MKDILLGRRGARLLLDALVLVFFIWLTVESQEFRSLAGYFPLAVGYMGIFLGTANLALGVYQGQKAARSDSLATSAPETPSSDDGDSPAEEEDNPVKALRYLAWIGGYFAGLWLVGALIANAAFLASFLHFESRVGIRFVVIGTAIASLFVFGLSSILNLRLPTGVLF